MKGVFGRSLDFMQLLKDVVGTKNSILLIKCGIIAVTGGVVTVFGEKIGDAFCTTFEIEEKLKARFEKLKLELEDRKSKKVKTEKEIEG